MKRSIVVFASALTLVLSLGIVASPAQAQILEKFFHSIGRDTARNNLWPDSFLPADRASVRAPFVLMVRNGWERQNLIADQHFESGTNELNGAGKLRIEWILTQATKPHRVIYLRRCMSPEDTAERLENIRKWAANYLPEGTEPNIMISTLAPVGWPAERVNAVDRKFTSSMPDPRLPEPKSDDGQGN
ncbi:MAG: hypothetical protein D6741_20150 [Planctomycetota bacterium]|nr:MAG: hypothetical protein D6741_20150 [Planctomycetota bacterium]